LALILISVAALLVITAIVKRIDRQRIIAGFVETTRKGIMENRFARPIMFAFTVARHPLDSYYYMKLEQKGSLGGAVFHFILFFVAYMVYITSRGFILQYTDIVDMDFVVIVGGFFGLFTMFIVSNYLVTSIKDGEGGIKDIFKLVSYGLFPLTVTLFGVTLLTHVVTQNEIFLVNFALTAGGIWAGVVLWLGFQETHNYSFRATLSSLIITVLFMLIILVVLFNLTVLFDGIVSFIESISSEVYINVTGFN